MTEVEHAVTAMTAGADDFMVKPLDRVALEATLIAARRVTELHDELRDQRSTLERLNSLLHDESRRDPLTLLGNRLRLTEDLAATATRTDRYGHSHYLAMCDIDYFKRYNDRLGHPAGDEALRAVAQAVAGAGQSGDMAYRYGGEEFVVLLRDGTPGSAVAALESIRVAVEDLGLAHPDNPPSGVVTISGGIAESGAARQIGVDEWLRRADVALYRAKALGRNRVVAFEDIVEVA